VSFFFRGKYHLITINIAVLTVSDTRSEESDTSGRLLKERISAAGHYIGSYAIVRDDIHHVRAHLCQAIIDDEINAVIINGGTGLTGRDGTPEAVSVLLDKEIDGFGELFRSLSYTNIGTSTISSRALAGIANATFTFCIPGSPNACELAWDKIIAPLLNSDTRPCNLVQLIPRLMEV